MILVVFVVTLAALSTANPLVQFRDISVRQLPSSCGGVTIPERCTQALDDYGQMLQQIFTNISSETGPMFVQAITTLLDVFCSPDCLDPTLAVDACQNNVSAENVINALICSRHEDGTLCPAKVVGELLRSPQNGSTPGLVPTCVTTTSTTCSSSCQQDYIDTRGRLGCCASSWYGRQSPFFSLLGQNFVTCNVSLTNPCSGAATICLNFLLVVIVLLLSMMVII